VLKCFLSPHEVFKKLTLSSGGVGNVDFTSSWWGRLFALAWGGVNSFLRVTSFSSQALI
jgi:hypothetical protein